MTKSGYDWLKPKETTAEFFKLPPSEAEKKVVDRSKLAPYKVEAKVVNILGRGICAYGHEIGDTFVFDGDEMKVVKSNGWANDLCAAPVSSLRPEIERFMWAAYLPDARGDKPDEKVKLANCNDLKSLCVFQLRRIKNPDSPYCKEKQ